MPNRQRGILVKKSSYAKDVVSIDTTPHCGAMLLFHELHREQTKADGAALN